MEQGIKEMKEVIVAMEALYLIGKKVLKDGQINFADTKYAAELCSQMPLFIAAVDGIGLVKGEAMDIQAEEAKEIVALMYGMAAKAQEV